MDTTQQTEAQNTTQPQKAKSTAEKVQNLFRWFACLSEWFSMFSEIHKKHFKNDTNNKTEVHRNDIETDFS